MEKWKARISDYHIDVIKDDGSGFGIVDFGTNDDLENADYPRDEAILNAHLISAAPELLELVKIMKEDFTGLYYQGRLSENGKKTYQKILDVIIKATGGE